MVNKENPFDVWMVEQLSYSRYNPSEDKRRWKDILAESPERLGEFIELLVGEWLIEIGQKSK